MTSYETDSHDTVIALYKTGVSASDLNNEVWEQCQPVYITQYWSGVDAPRSRHAEVRICWSDEELIVRFVGEQKEPLVVIDNPLTDRKTKGLWDRDVCEIFVAPDVTNINRYFEFEAAPSGEWIDLAIEITADGRQTQWDYASGMKTMAQIADDRIIVALSIPWSERIPKPTPGDEWRANLFRCIGSDEATRYLAWRPTQTLEPNFHVPEAFGVLRFV